MFLRNALAAGEQASILYVLVAVGVIADKFGVYTETAARKCVDLLFYIVTPAVIIESFTALKYDPQTAKSLLAAIGCGFLLHGVAALISALVFNRSPAGDAGVYKFACAYGNCGYMALPLANAVLGEKGVFYCSAVIISFQVFSFTHGIYVISRGGEAKFDFKKLVLNPGVLSVAVGLPLFFLSVSLPKIVADPLRYLASLNTPLAMLIFGTYIARTNFKTLIRNRRIFAAAFIKLVLLPLTLLPVFRLMGIAGDLLVALSISAGVPSANNTVLFAAKYDGDVGLASQTVAVISFISVITLPLMIAFAKTAG